MMLPQVEQLGASPMLYMDCMAEAVWYTLRSSTVSRGLACSIPDRAVRSGAMPCCGGLRSLYWKASPWSSWVAGASLLPAP